MRVVLVDPSRTVLKIVGQLLEARGHDVRPFAEGPAALDYIRAHSEIDVLITSAELVGMSGMEVCWEARATAGSRRSIYVLMMSSIGDERKRVEALDCGADDFINKPPAREELYARLRVAERIASMQRELIHLATVDPLTGVLNRRAFFEKAAEACARAAAGGKLSAIMVDIDHFKRVNDTYGHSIGDEVIRGVANLASVGQHILGRLGGEEFALLLEAVALPDAVAFAEDLRRKYEAFSVPRDGSSIGITCSLGVSEWQPGDTIDALLRRADAALYQAKQAGRNRVVPAAPDMVVSVQGGSGAVRAGPRER